MKMTNNGKIDSGKLLVKEIFTNYWFNIPVYQRAYVWRTDEVSELLDDLRLAIEQNLSNNPKFEYFFGSFVFQSKAPGSENGQKYLVNDLLDGQQRMATLLMLFAVIRDLVGDVKAKKTCQGCIFQEEDTYKGTPEQTRIAYVSHPKVTEFFNKYIKTEKGTLDKGNLNKERKKSVDRSVQNMANAVIVMHKFFHENPIDLTKFLEFLLKNVLFIYVSTENLEDAFRLFRVLNDRGVQLRGSDILKSINMSALKSEDERKKYAEMWENAEGELGDNGEGFERFLNYVRTILVLDRSRYDLTDEFELKIYKPNKLQKGQATFDLVEEYLKYYRELKDAEISKHWLKNYEFDTLLKVMLTGLLGKEWIPPLLCYRKKFEWTRIMEFLKLLDIKYSSDWIGRQSPTDRKMGMIEIIKVINAANNVDDVFRSKCFEIKDKDSFIREIRGPVYGRSFARYLLLKLDYFWADHGNPMPVELSVEHILPQNPADSSDWVKKFSPEERDEWTHKIGNLVLITGNKDTELGRLDYPMKKIKYFKERITTCPHALHVYDLYKEWTPKEVKENHQEALEKLCEHYGINQADFLSKMNG
jgi:uncharacterized protein with ParB-like and HNH nuclease domain